MTFDAAALDWPVRGQDPDYAKILTPLLEDAVADAEGDFVSAVRSAMRTRIGAGSLTRDSVCRALGLNARTLAHRLEAFGVTFSGLADEVRFDAAQSLLLKGRRVGEIAAELGFRRAWRVHPRLQDLVGDHARALAGGAQIAVLCEWPEYLRQAPEALGQTRLPPVRVETRPLQMLRSLREADLK